MFEQGLTRCLGKIDLLYLLDISFGLSKGCTKYQSSKIYLVVSSTFYESVYFEFYPNPCQQLKFYPYLLALGLDQHVRALAPKRW